MVVHAQEGIEMSNEIARLHFLLGKALVGLENYELALESLKKAQRLDQGDKLEAEILDVEKKLKRECENKIDKEMTFSP